MWIERSQCRKARVIRETVEKDGRVSRRTIIDDGVAVAFTSLGAYIFSPKEMKELGRDENDLPIWVEWFPYESKEGIKTIVYC